MRYSILAGVLVFLTTVCLGQDTQDATDWTEDYWLLSGGWKQQETVLGSESNAAVNSDGCEVSHVTAFEISKGRAPVFFSTSAKDHFELPKISPMNETAGEQWEFDAVSDDGLSGVILGFYRDPNYSLLGSGNLRMYIEIAFPPETGRERFVQIDYPTESTVERCPGAGTRGEWKGNGYRYAWHVSENFDRARVVWDTPKTRGSLTLTRSLAPPRYADGSTWPDETSKASTLTVPHFYWVEPIPVSEAMFDAVVDGRQEAWSGIAGHERLWGAYNWLTCLDALTLVRLRAGPYALTFLELESWLYKGLRVPSAVLAEDGKKIFSSRSTGEPTDDSDQADFFTWEKTYGGEGITGSLSDKATGFVLDLVSPSKGKQWTFLITHKNIYFEYFLGGGVGGTGFTATVAGGQVGSQRQFTGVAGTEILKLPEKSLLLKRNYVK
ncbi:hypothetical protein B0H63DRAFT_432924 [Podospora didyma]|uniref:Uncharacterized protein n=1 Tax=Podospora didyma TaxID=330526 RepID=A0AAE0TZK9_9PEZI|nr:hypothetical protein B0H63DRAFT_432924 [Podospora didyma]